MYAIEDLRYIGPSFPNYMTEEHQLDKNISTFFLSTASYFQLEIEHHEGVEVAEHNNCMRLEAPL